MRLLLDFQANPNVYFENTSLLTIAASYGNAEVMQMLLDTGAERTPERGESPLLAALKYGSRECLSVLLVGHEKDVLMEFDGIPFIIHAINEKSNLLPVITTLYIEEVKKLEQDGMESKFKYPPEGLSKKDLNMLKLSEELHDKFYNAGSSQIYVKRIKCPWRVPQQIQEQPGAIQQSEFDSENSGEYNTDSET